jgi:DNA phosphorothioation-associated putative methyltransferase
LFEQPELVAAAATRTEDYLVHFAMTLFPGAPSYASLPRSIQRDVRAFFGSHAAALDAARELLFSAGRLPVILEGVETAVAGVLGAMRDADTLRFHVSSLNRFPAVLRVLVGCAAMLRGGVEGTDFVDVKLDGRRVVFLSCIDGSSRFPIVSERTRVDLSKLRATVDKPDGLVLYLKGRFLPYDAPEREEQMAFDQKLLLSGAVSEDGRGPRLTELHEFLRRQRSGP